jgi:hypothetical protein
MPEKNGKCELIVIDYLLAMGKYTRTQIVFVVTTGVSVFFWVLYFSVHQLPIIVPIIFSIMAAQDFYVFVRWYLAVTGCFTDSMKDFEAEIQNLKKKDRYKFVEEAIKKR